MLLKAETRNYHIDLTLSSGEAAYRRARPRIRRGMFFPLLRYGAEAPTQDEEVGVLVRSLPKSAFPTTPLQAARFFPNRSEYAFGMNSKPMVPFASMKVRWETRL